MIIDNDLTYDAVRKRYALRSEYVKNEMGLDLNAVLYDELDSNTTTMPKRTLRYTSDMVYDYLKMQAVDYKYAIELIENNAEVHDDFKDALYHQLVYFIEAGDLALSSDGDLSKAISKRALQCIYKILIAQRPRKKQTFFGKGWSV